MGDCVFVQERDRVEEVIVDSAGADGESVTIFRFAEERLKLERDFLVDVLNVFDILRHAVFQEQASRIAIAAECVLAPFFLVCLSSSQVLRYGVRNRRSGRRLLAGRLLQRNAVLLRVRTDAAIFQDHQCLV